MGTQNIHLLSLPCTTIQVYPTIMTAPSENPNIRFGYVYKTFITSSHLSSAATSRPTCLLFLAAIGYGWSASFLQSLMSTLTRSSRTFSAEARLKIQGSMRPFIWEQEEELTSFTHKQSLCSFLRLLLHMCVDSWTESWNSDTQHLAGSKHIRSCFPWETTLWALNRLVSRGGTFIKVLVSLSSDLMKVDLGLFKILFKYKKSNWLEHNT